MQLHVNTASPWPIYRQLVEQIREGIARGALRPGDRLPSVRQLSQQLVVNPNTIARCYTELEREGAVNARQGVGVFVAEPKAELTRQARQARLVEMLDRLLTEAVHLGFSAEQVIGLVNQRIKRFRWPGADPKPN